MPSQSSIVRVGISSSLANLACDSPDAVRSSLIVMLPPYSYCPPIAGRARFGVRLCYIHFAEPDALGDKLVNVFGVPLAEVSKIDFTLTVRYVVISPAVAVTICKIGINADVCRHGFGDISRLFPKVHEAVAAAQIGFAFGNVDYKVVACVIAHTVSALGKVFNAGDKVAVMLNC